MKLTLFLSLTLLFAITLLSGFDFADALKSSGTTISRTGVDICGDRLCDEGEELTPQEKLAYYLLSLIEFDDSTVIQQSRFSVGGVAQQASGFNPSMSEISITKFTPYSVMDRGVINSMAVPLEQPKLRVDLARPSGGQAIPSTSQQLAPLRDGIGTVDASLNVGTLAPKSYAKIIDNSKIFSGKIDMGKIQIKCFRAPCVGGSEDLRKEYGEVRVAQEEFDRLKVDTTKFGDLVFEEKTSEDETSDRVAERKWDDVPSLPSSDNDIYIGHLPCDAFTPTITLNSNSYSMIDPIRVTVEDKCKNSSPQKIDRVMIKVSSSHESRQIWNLWETSPDSGIFKIALTGVYTEPSNNELTVTYPESGEIIDSVTVPISDNSDDVDIFDSKRLGDSSHNFRLWLNSITYDPNDTVVIKLDDFDLDEETCEYVKNKNSGGTDKVCKQSGILPDILITSTSNPKGQIVSMKPYMKTAYKHDYILERSSGSLANTWERFMVKYPAESFVDVFGSKVKIPTVSVSALVVEEFNTAPEDMLTISNVDSYGRTTEDTIIFTINDGYANKDPTQSESVLLNFSVDIIESFSFETTLEEQFGITPEIVTTTDPIGHEALLVKETGKDTGIFEIELPQGAFNFDRKSQGGSVFDHNIPEERAQVRYNTEYGNLLTFDSFVMCFDYDVPYTCR